MVPGLECDGSERGFENKVRTDGIAVVDPGLEVVLNIEHCY